MRAQIAVLFKGNTGDVEQTITEQRHDKTNKMSVRPTKTQIRLDIRPVW